MDVCKSNHLANGRAIENAIEPKISDPIRCDSILSLYFSMWNKSNQSNANKIEFKMFFHHAILKSHWFHIDLKFKPFKRLIYTTEFYMCLCFTNQQSISIHIYRLAEVFFSWIRFATISSASEILFRFAWFSNQISTFERINNDVTRIKRHTLLLKHSFIFKRNQCKKKSRNGFQWKKILNLNVQRKSKVEFQSNSSRTYKHPHTHIHIDSIQVQKLNEIISSTEKQYSTILFIIYKFSKSIFVKSKCMWTFQIYYIFRRKL